MQVKEHFEIFSFISNILISFQFQLEESGLFWTFFSSHEAAWASFIDCWLMKEIHPSDCFCLFAPTFWEGGRTYEWYIVNRVFRAEPFYVRIVHFCAKMGKSESIHWLWRKVKSNCQLCIYVGIAVVTTFTYNMTGPPENLMPPNLEINIVKFLIFPDRF